MNENFNHLAVIDYAKNNDIFNIHVYIYIYIINSLRSQFKPLLVTVAEVGDINLVPQLVVLEIVV